MCKALSSGEAKILDNVACATPREKTPRVRIVHDWEAAGPAVTASLQSVNRDLERLPTAEASRDLRTPLRRRSTPPILRVRTVEVGRWVT